MTRPAPNTIRNACARLVVECERRWSLSPKPGHQSAGWQEAGALLDIPWRTIQRVTRGLPVRESTIERVRLALVTTGAMSPKDVMR